MMSRLYSKLRLNHLLLTAPGASADPCRSGRGKPVVVQKTCTRLEDVDVKLALLSVWGKAGKACKAGKGVVLVTERDVKMFQTCKTSHFGHFGLARTACHCQKAAVAAAGDATNLLETDFFLNTVIPLDRFLPILMLNHVPTMTHHEDPCTLKHIETY